jgi:hypothetical protein
MPAPFHLPFLGDFFSPQSKKTIFEIAKSLYLYIEKAGAGSDLFTTASLNEE